MPLPRFRIRTLMIAVAVVALVFVLRGWSERSSRQRYIATWYGVSEATNRANAAALSGMIRQRTELIASTERLLAGEEERDSGRAATYRSDLVRERESLTADREKEAANARLGTYYTAMRRKHDRAARRPWLPVPPDPPPPE